MATDKIILGYSNQTLFQMQYPPEINGHVNTCKWEFDDSFLRKISAYEDRGYTVRFRTSIWRKIFCLHKYKVVAYK